jgi:transcriptional regulator with XRE-family HTH domain
VWANPRDYKRVGRILASARKEKDVSQQALAIRLAKPQSFISSYENGQRRIDVLELIEICRGLQVEPQKVFESIVSGLPKRARSS